MNSKVFRLFFLLSISLLFGCNKAVTSETKIGTYKEDHGVPSEELFPFKIKNEWVYNISRFDTGGNIEYQRKENMFIDTTKHVEGLDTFLFICFRNSYNSTPKLGDNHYEVVYRNKDKNTLEGLHYSRTLFTQFDDDNSSERQLGNYTYFGGNYLTTFNSRVGFADFANYNCYVFICNTYYKGDLFARQIYYVKRGIGIVGKDSYRVYQSKYFLEEKWTLIDYYLQ